MAQEAPYKLSRAALRDRFGSRAITSGGQSERDDTPSGRIARAMQQGKTEEAAKDVSEQAFYAKFKKREGAPNFTPMGVATPPRTPFGGSLFSPDAGNMFRSNLAMGNVKTPFGTQQLAPPKLGLAPETAAVDDLIPFFNQAPAPLSNFSLPGRLFGQQSRWRQSIYG